MINPHNVLAVNLIEPKNIAFPSIQFDGIPALNLKRTTIKAAFTNISNCGAGHFINDLDWDPRGDILWQNQTLQLIADLIKNLITEYYHQPNDKLLTKVFVLIQLWGGNAGRQVFVNGNGWVQNFNINEYKKAIKLVESNLYKEAIQVINKGIYGLSTSFSSKHIHFWSYGKAPIYDSIISKIVFGTKEPRLNDYNEYLNALDGIIEKIGNPNISRNSIERNLFNWASTDTGKQWIKLRITPEIKS
jgi:hypothetical protein